MAAAAAATPGGRAGAPRESLFAQAQGLLRELPGLVSDRFELLSLELRRAGSALVKIVVLVLAAAILGITAWLVLWAALVGGLIVLGLHWSAALLVALLINLVAIAVALLWARRLLPLLQMPATRRHLTPTPSPRPHVSTDVPPAVRPQPAAPSA